MYLLVLLQVLQQKFDDFQHELNASEDRVTSLHAKATSMLEANHYESVAIKKRDEEITQIWVDLREVTVARQEVRNRWLGIIF